MSNKMRCILKFLILFLAFCLECTVLDSVEIFSVRPDLLLILIVSLSLLSSQTEMIIYSVFFGALTDILWGPVFGVHTLLFMYLALICTILNKRIYSENYVTMCLYIFLTTIVYESVFATITFLMWGNTELIYTIIIKIVIQAIYNSCLIVPVFACVKRIFRSDRGQYYRG